MLSVMTTDQGSRYQLKVRKTQEGGGGGGIVLAFCSFSPKLKTLIKRK